MVTPVAIIGMGCRFPAAPGLPAFWRLIREGGIATEPVPPERLALAGALADSPSATPGAGWGGFIDRLDTFDHELFGISAAEATRMDPQQRIVLEVMWAALEDAGLVPDSLAGTATGVFVGQGTPDYALLRAADDDQEPGPYGNPGLSAAVSANRVSYLWDLHGPSLTVDTACSSSLVAAHLAVTSLQTDECDLALVGGVNVLLSALPQLGAAGMTALAPDGSCRPFDAAASGYVRAEGGGGLVLKRLADAERDGDEVRAVIAGSAVNSDGRTNGLTAPSGRAQVEVIGTALRRAGLTPDSVDYVEAHGTGTRLGDPIETRALATAFAGREEPLLVGSVKANIGHAEAAAGIAGLVKTALMVEEGVVAANAALRELNPLIDTGRWPLELPTAPRPWPARGRRVAQVNSFGFGGTNASVVVAAREPVVERVGELSAPAEPGPVMLAFSAQSPWSMRALAPSYADAVRACRDWAEVADLASAAAGRRSHLRYRRAVVAADREELLSRLAEPGGEPAPVPSAAGGLAFVYSGHGSQWAGMGRGLLDVDRAFTAAVDACDRAFSAHLGWSVAAALRDPAGVDLDRTGIAQPLIVTIQLALTAALRERGVCPDAVLGHSIGEVSAAVTAGLLDVAAAAVIVHARTAAVAGHPGGMAAVGLGVEDLASMLAGSGVTVAAENSPASSVICGQEPALTDVIARLTAAGHRVRRADVDYPSHGPSMAGPAAELRVALDGLPQTAAESRAHFYSSVTGEPTEGPLDAAYWADNLSQPVRFAPAVGAMLADGIDRFVELSPHPLLVLALAECAGTEPVAVAGTLRRDEPPAHGVADVVAGMYEAGITRRFPRGPDVALRRLPTYPFAPTPVPTLGLADQKKPSVTTLPVRLAAADETERGRLIVDEIRMLLGLVLPAGAPVEPAATFHTLGVDSLIAVELRNRLSRRIGRPVPVTLLWSHPTVERLAAELARPSGSGLHCSTPPTVRQGSAPDAGELLRLLDEVDAELSRDRS